MTIITGSPIPAILPFLAIMSFKKKKKGAVEEAGDDPIGTGDNLIIPEGDSTQLGGDLGNVLGGSSGGDLGKGLGGDAGAAAAPLGGSLGGSLGGGLDSLGSLSGGDELLGGLQSREEVINNLTAQQEDMKGQIETLQIQSKGIVTDIAGIKEELTSLNESMKSLLCIYEAVSNEYNPFVDDSKKKGKKAEAAPQTEGMDLTELINKKEEPMPLSQAVQMPAPAFAPAPAVVPAPKAEELPEGSYYTDTYCLNQVHKLIDFQFDRIYTKKQKNERVSDGELDALVRWIGEMRRMEVK